MGYRSDVTAVFYAENEDDFPVIKLWVDENIKDETYEQRGLYLLYEIRDVKWYDSYEYVRAFHQAMEDFADTFDGQEGRPKGRYEFIRIGEEPSDIEEQCSEYMQVLYVRRSIEVNI